MDENSLMSSNNLSNEKNYNSSLVNDPSEILLQYFNVVKEYLYHAGENIVIPDHTYYIFTIKRGLECIKHIFNMLLLYTNNLDMVVFHCKKSYLYYIEFINQIGTEDHSYLQLNSKDAALFIYKKTIFDINNEKRINFTVHPEDKEKLDYLYKFGELMNEIIVYVYDNDNIKGDLKMSYIMYIINMTSKVKDKIIKSTQTILCKTKICENIIYFLKSINTKNIEDECAYLNICNIFTKKALSLKNNVTIENIDQKFIDKEFDHILNSYTPLKFINWILSI